MADRAASDEDLVGDVVISKILQEWECDPFERVVWPELDRPITREEVVAAIHTGFPRGTVPYAGLHTIAFDRESHVHRVAFFVVNGWTDAVDMDLGCPSLGYHSPWPIQDGNHRFAAAVYLGHQTIRANLEGETGWIRKFRVKPKG